MRDIERNQKGFSLIELMIVVGIIGVLATMAVPKFSAFQAKAKQTEAKTTLNHIYTLQEAYFIDFSQYSGATTAANYGATTGTSPGTNDCADKPWATAIGFKLTPCNNQKPIYGYSTTANGGSYRTLASTGGDNNNKLFPGCTTKDTWTMVQTHTLSHTIDAIKVCN